MVQPAPNECPGFLGLKLKQIKTNWFQNREKHIFFGRWLNQLVHNHFQGWKFHWNQWESVNVKTFQDTGAVIFKKSYLSHPQISKLWTALWVLAEPSSLHWFSSSHRLRQESLISHCAWRTGWFQFHPQAPEPASPRLKLWERHTRLVIASSVRKWFWSRIYPAMLPLHSTQHNKWDK